jgi:hypothetical protein
MDVRLLGSFEVHRAGSPLALGGYRQRAVLAILALAPNERSLPTCWWSGCGPAARRGARPGPCRPTCRTCDGCWSPTGRHERRPRS